MEEIENLEGEVWKVYNHLTLLSNKGRVIKFKRVKGRFQINITLGYKAKRYYSFSGSDNKTKMVAREVWRLFNGEIKKHHIIANKNGDNYDNRLENLEQKLKPVLVGVGAEEDE